METVHEISKRGERKRGIMKRIFFPVICILIVGFAGCTTAPISSDFNLAPLDGKVFDFDNTPCADVLVTVDDGVAVRSDINGRIWISALNKGKHMIKATKENYEDYVETFTFLNRNQVIWIRIMSLDQLEKRIDKAFEEKKWDDAEALIDRALKVRKDAPVIMYYQALFFIQNGWFEQAMGVLETITTNGYNEPIVYLTMADTAEYNLGNKDLAITYLRKYLDLKTDDNVLKRLNALMKNSN
jgi:tetratricopeptide (TPR) repeat protein